MNEMEQGRTPQQQLRTNFEQNGKTTQSASFCILAVCEQHAT